MKVSENKPKSISFRVEKDLFDWLSSQAAKLEISVSEYVRIMLTYFFMKEHENNEDNK